MRPPLAQKDPPQLQGPVTVNPALSYRNMPIRSRYPQFAVHHDRPISVSSLDRRRGCEKLSRKDRWSSYEEGVHDFGYCSLRPSEGFRQTGRLAHSRTFPSSGISAANPVAGAVQLADPSSECSWQSLVWSCRFESTQGHAIKTDTTCAAATGKLTRKLPTRHPPAAPRAQLRRSQAAPSWDISATGCCAATRAGLVHGVSVSGARCSARRWRCDDEADCERVWTLSSS